MPTFVKVTRYNSSVGSFEYSKFSTAPLAIFLYKILFSSNVLRKLASDTDTTMLTVTHEMNFAREFADRVLFFDAGQIVESGKPENIFANPEKRRTKEFLKKFINNVN